MRNDLQNRLFDFTVKVLKLIRDLPKQSELNVIKYQLAKSSTSSGANYEESQAGSSKADFRNKVRISLREMRESNYWLRILEALEVEQISEEKLNLLLQESLELKKILGSIVTKTR